MSLSQWAVTRPVAVTMVFLATSLLGGVSLWRLPVNLLPEVGVPQLVVYTTDPEVGPTEVERRVTQPVEAALAALPRVEGVSSLSQEGLSLVTVRFGWGTPMDPAILEVRERLDALREFLPEGAQRPRILRVDPASEPILTLSLAGGDPGEMREWAQTVVRRRLEQREGVAQARVTGGVEREIQVEVDLERLQGFGISLAEVAQALDQANRAGAGGSILDGRIRVPLRTIGEFRTLQDIEEVVLRAVPGEGGRSTPVRVRDVAQVREGFADREEIARHGGRESVGILLFKESGANTVRVAAAVEEVLAQLQRESPTTEIEIVASQAGFIREAIASVVSALAVGGLLAFGVLFLFLGEPRRPLLLALALPASVLGTFGLMDVFGVSLNVMSLGGLALGVGMWLDNSILVLENLTRHAEEGESPRDAAVLGAREVSGAMTTSTLTTIAVFVPLLFVRGVAGELFRDLALTVSFSLLVSLGVAHTLLPALAAGLPPPRGGAPERSGLSQRGIQRFLSVYHRVLEGTLARPIRVLLGSLVVFCGALAWALTLDRDLFPQVDTGAMEMELELPRGTPLERTHTVVQRIEAAWRDDPSVSVFASLGRDAQSLARTGEVSGFHRARFQVRWPPGIVTAEDLDRFRDRVQQALSEVAPEGTLSFRAGRANPLGFLLEAGEAGLAIRIRGEDVAAARIYGEHLRHLLSGSRRWTAVRLPVEGDRPQIQIEILREEAARFGVSPSSIVDLLERGMRGVRATDFVSFDQRIPIRVRLPPAQRQDLSTLDLLAFEGVPLATWIEVTSGEEPSEIRREGQARVLTLRADLGRRGLGQAVREVQATVEANPPPPESGLRVEVGGEGDEMRRSFRDLLLASVLALLLVFMLLAAHFESILLPGVILAAVPLAGIGTVGALGITGSGWNTLSGIGLVILIGMVVNDAIVKVDFIERARRAGWSAPAAVLEAGRVRLRPILMTTTTTVVGLLPMVWGLGAGADLRAPLATALLGGLASSTVLTLVVVPVLYVLVDGRRRS